MQRKKNYFLTFENIFSLVFDFYGFEGVFKENYSILYGT